MPGCRRRRSTRYRLIGARGLFANSLFSIFIVRNLVCAADEACVYGLAAAQGGPVMKFAALVFLLMTLAFSARAAEVETDCRDYDGGFHAEAMRLKMLESKNAAGDKAASSSQDVTSTAVPAGDRASGGNRVERGEK
jgi:hypothetical protein